MVSPGHGSTGGLRAAATRLCDGSLRIVPRGSREPVSHPSDAEAWGPLPRFPAPLGARRPLHAGLLLAASVWGTRNAERWHLRPPFFR